MTKSLKNKRGFTLVEIIVSLAIFSVVAVIAIGALLKIIAANKKAQTLQSSLTNLNYGLDTMSRELRVGSKFYCDTSESYGYNGNSMLPSACQTSSLGLANGHAYVIAFISSEAATNSLGVLCTPAFRAAHAYRFYNLNNVIHLQKAVQNTCGSGGVNGIQPENFSDIVSVSNVHITAFTLNVRYDQTTQPYPYAFISISGNAGVTEKDKTYFNVQTANTPLSS